MYIEKIAFRYLYGDFLFKGYFLEKKNLIKYLEILLNIDIDLIGKYIIKSFGVRKKWIFFRYLKFFFRISVFVIYIWGLFYVIEGILNFLFVFRFGVKNFIFF